MRSAPPGTSKRPASAATRGRSNQCQHCPAATTSQLAASSPVPSAHRPRGGRAWAGRVLAGPGSAWRREVFWLGMVLLSERAQPAEELVNDAAELTPHDQRVEHGGGRFGWRVERLDPHRGLVACRRGEMGGEPVAGEHLAEPEGVVNNQERRARLWHGLDAPLGHPRPGATVGYATRIALRELG